MKKIFLVAGEASGDLHGAKLMEELKQLHPGIQFSGVFGPKMRSQGGNTVLKMEELQQIGFWEVFRSLPSILCNFKLVVEAILHTNPDLLVLIDYPGFNLRLAKSLRKRGFKKKIVQYICPTLWAWRPSRRETLEKYYDALFVLLPFEKESFLGSSLPVEFVGHPLRDLPQTLSIHGTLKSSLSIADKSHLYSFFPGSRPSEIALNFPTMMMVIEELSHKDPSAIFAISCSSPKIQSLIAPHLSSLSCKEKCRLVPSQLNYALMRESRAALAKSGTVVLELALSTTPTVAIYKVRWIERFLLRYLFKISLPFFTLPNILLKKEIVKEHIRKETTANQIAEELFEFAHDSKKTELLKKELSALPTMLSPPPQNSSLASLMLQVMEK